MLDTSEIAAFVATSTPAEALKFYRDVLGLTLISDEEYALVFDANGVSLRVQKAGPFTPHQFTTLGWHVKDIDASMRELRSKGVVFEQYPWMPEGSDRTRPSPSG